MTADDPIIEARHIYARFSGLGTDEKPCVQRVEAEIELKPLSMSVKNAVVPDSMSIADTLELMGNRGLYPVLIGRYWLVSNLRSGDTLNLTIDITRKEKA